MSDVVELDPDDPRATVCGTCGRGWDDSISTSVTPTPSGRCPFEYEHEYKDEENLATKPEVVQLIGRLFSTIERMEDIVDDALVALKPYAPHIAVKLSGQVDEIVQEWKYEEERNGHS